MIFSFLASHLTNLISQLGYGGVFLLMVLESMVVPVPSEAVMPFAGFLVVSGNFLLIKVMAISTLGSLVGSLISYYIGLYGGLPLLEKYGKYLFLNNHDLAKTHEFFQRRGEITVFVCRFIPVIRHLISLPAGFGKMNVFKFSLYTVIGAGLWNTFLAVLGMSLKQNWEQLARYSEILDVLVVLVLLIGIIYFIRKHLKSKAK